MDGLGRTKTDEDGGMGRPSQTVQGRLRPSCLEWCSASDKASDTALLLWSLLLPDKHIRCPAGQAHDDGCEDGGAEAVGLE